MERDKPQILSLLKQQAENYRQALELERELSRLISVADSAPIKSNSEHKQQLMGEIKVVHEQLEPLLKQHLGGRGELPDPECERLRREAVTLLLEIGELESANLKSVKKARTGFARDLRTTQAAKRAARGYKPSIAGRPRYLDIKS